jgi:hypothetical protein
MCVAELRIARAVAPQLKTRAGYAVEGVLEYSALTFETSPFIIARLMNIMCVLIFKGKVSGVGA